MYISADVAERIKEMAKQRNIPVKKLLNDVGMGFNTMSNMKNSMPKADNLAKIADYLGCSVDYLLGREEDTQKKPAPEAGNGLSEKDMRILAKIMALPDDKFDDAMDYLDYLISKGEKK